MLNILNIEDDINTSMGHLPVALSLTIGSSLRDFEQSKNKALINAFSVNASPLIRSAHCLVLSLPNEDGDKYTNNFTNFSYRTQKNFKIIPLLTVFTEKGGRKIKKAAPKGGYKFGALQSG